MKGWREREREREREKVDSTKLLELLITMMTMQINYVKR